MWRNEYAQDMYCVLRVATHGEKRGVHVCVSVCGETLGCCKARYCNAMPTTR